MNVSNEPGDDWKTAKDNHLSVQAKDITRRELSKCINIVHRACILQSPEVHEIASHISIRLANEAPSARWTPSGCYNPQGCGRPPAASPQRSGAVDPGGYLPCPGSWPSRCQ
eukprot:scaffold41_cov370-Pavlova_lutheri.AAC.14